MRGTNIKIPFSIFYCQLADWINRMCTTWLIEIQFKQAALGKDDPSSLSLTAVALKSFDLLQTWMTLVLTNILN